MLRSTDLWVIDTAIPASDVSPISRNRSLVIQIRQPMIGELFANLNDSIGWFFGQCPRAKDISILQHEVPMIFAVGLFRKLMKEDDKPVSRHSGKACKSLRAPEFSDVRNLPDFPKIPSDRQDRQPTVIAQADVALVIHGA